MNVYFAPLGADGKALGEPRIATNHEANNDCCAAVSPDGKRLAYYSRSPKVLVIRELSTGSEQEFPLNLEINFLLSTGPAWFPDGRSVMVHGSVPQRGGNRQYRVDLATARAELMSTKDVFVHSRLSPDGQAILHGPYPLRWQNLSNQEIVTLKEEPGVSYFSPTISLDGKEIAYWHRSGGGVLNIVVASKDGSDARVVCACEFPGTSAPMNVLTWTPDRRHLLFADPGGTFWRVPVNGGERERLGVSAPSRVQGPNVQPDGRGLYFTVRDGSAPAELWVLENFLPAAAR